MEEDFSDFPFVRGGLINKMSKLTYYAKTKQHLVSIDRQIDEINDSMDPNDKRGFRLKTIRLEMLQKQQERLIDKLLELEMSIKKDIDDSKNEL